MDWMIGKGTSKTHKTVIFQTFDVEWILEVIFPLQVILSVIVSYSCAHCWVDPQGPSPPPPKKRGIWRRPKIGSPKSQSDHQEDRHFGYPPIFNRFQTKPQYLFHSMSNCKILINFAVSNPWRRGSYWVGQGQGRWAQLFLGKVVVWECEDVIEMGI